MRKPYGVLACFFALSCLIFSGNLFAQSFVSASKSARVTDRDNNGYANIGDLINLYVVANTVTSDSINAAVLFGRYGTPPTDADTLYLTKSGGTGGNGTGDGVVFVNTGGDVITEKAVGNGLNAIKASTATNPTNGIFRFILYRRLGPAAGNGPKNILQTEDVNLVGDGTTVAFKDTIDNERPQTPTTRTVLLTTTVGDANVAGIGDQLKFTISEAGTGGTLSKVALFFNGAANQIQPLVDINQSVLSTTSVVLGNTPFDAFAFTAPPNNNFISMTKNATNWEATVTLKDGQIDQAGSATTGAFVYAVDQYGNISSTQFNINPLANVIDNKVSDLYVNLGGGDTVTTANAVQDSLMDLTTDGNGGAYIIGTKAIFKYTEPAGNFNKINSVNMDLSMFGGAASVPLAYSYTTGGGARVYKTPIQTFAQTTTDAAMNTLRPRITITDSAGNVLNTYGRSNVATAVDLVPPGSFSVVLSLTTESTIPNNLGNPGETVTATFSGLNADATGYRFLANNNHVNTNFTAQQRNLLASPDAVAFPTAGNIDGGGNVVVNASGIAMPTFTLGSYTPTGTPTGLNIAANNAAGTITFIARDNSGNEAVTTATMPFPVNNIMPDQPQSATLTLVDVNGNGIANIGDSLTVTISGSGVDAALQTAYVRFYSTLFGDIGQQVHNNIDATGTDLGDNDGGLGRPDWILVAKSGNSFVKKVPIINDLSAEFVGQTMGVNALTVDYRVVDNSFNMGGVFTTSPLIQGFDNQISTPAAIQASTAITTTNPNAYKFNNTWGTGVVLTFSNSYISVGSTVTMTVSGMPTDVDTVFADLRALGLTANEKIPRVGTTATKVISITASTGAYMDFSSSLDSARIPITFRDDAGNISLLNTASISAFTGGAIRHIDRNKPIAIPPSRVTFTHTDFDVVGGTVVPSNNNGLINPNERIRIKIDVSNQPDFVTTSLGLGTVIVDLSAFGYANQILMDANVAAPGPNSVVNTGMVAGTNYGYDDGTKSFYIELVVQNGGLELASNSTMLVIRNVVDNAGNQVNPTKDEALYQSVTYNKQLDAITPVIDMGSTVNSFAFSSSTDVNGDGIAAVNDGVQINAVVTGADSVFADLRPIGRGFVPMTLGVGNNWSIPSIDVLQGTDPQWASDNDLGATSITIIAQDNAGNQTTATTVAMNVDNLVTKAPTVTVTPASGGRFNVRMENGQSSNGTLGTATFANDMNGGTVPNTTMYRIEYDSTGSGTWSLAANVAYGGSPTTFTSTQIFSQGRVVAFRVTPFDDAGNQGTTSIPANGVAQATLPPSVTYEPATGTIIGATGVVFRARIDSANAAKITAATFRARAVDEDPGTAGNQPGDWFTIGGSAQTGGVWSSAALTSGSFTGTPSNGHGYQVVVLLTDNATPVNTQTEDQAVAANGSITIFADNQAPQIYLTSVSTNGVDSTFNGLDNSPAPFLDIKARGIASFRFNITDNLPLNVNTATMLVQLNGTSLYNTQTFASLVNAGVLGVNGNTYTLNINTAPYIATNPTLGVQITDGHGNTNATFGTATGFGYNFQFSVDDNVAPAFYMVQPYPYTTFGNGAGGIPQFTVQLTQTDPAAAASFVEGVIEISTDAAFTSPATVTTIFAAGATVVQVPTNAIGLVSGTKYWVRAVLRDANGNRSITDANPVYYDTSVPTFTLSLPQAIMVSGVNRVRATTRLQITPSTSDVVNWRIRSRRIDQDTTTYVNFTGTLTQKPIEFNWVTTTNYNAYEGYVVLEVTGTDNSGNVIPAQYFPVFVDNLAPSYRITAVNGDEEISSFSPMLAGDTLKVRVETINDDVAATDFFISNYNGSGGTVTVRGFVAQQQGNVYTVHFPLPASSATNVVSINPAGVVPVITYTLRDSVGNVTAVANYVGSPTIGSVTVIGNQQPTALFRNIQRFYRLKGSLTVRTKTSGMTDVNSGDGSVRFEIRRPNAPNFEVIATDGTEPYEFTLTTTNFPDGNYLLRIVPLDNNTIQKEYTPDTLTVIIDNTNNGTTERAAIVNLGNAVIGGANITLSATAGVDVGSVRFDARYVGGRNSAGTQLNNWFNLSTGSGVTNTVRNPDNSFSQTFSSEELRAIFGLGTVSALDGEVEFRAVAEDNANYEFVVLNTPGTAVPLGTGNVDDPSVVATTRATFDFTAPAGIATVNNAVLTATQKNTWGGMNNTNFNLFDGSVTVRADVAPVTDFGSTLITLTRYNSVDPGTGPAVYGDGLGEGKEKVVASFGTAAASTYTFNTSSLTRGGLYEIKVYLRDVIGNQQQIERFFFIAGKPHAYVSGYNQEHNVINILGHNNARSARVDYSTDNGTTYTNLTYVNMSNQFGSGNLDRARWAQASVANITLPAGVVLFRVTASELPYASPAAFAQSRFASSPTVFSLTVDANGDWEPTDLALSNIGLTLNRQYGDLTNIRVEAQPQNSNDPVALTMVGDNVLNVSSNTLTTEFFPYQVAFSPFSNFFINNNLTLTGVDGNVLGFNTSVSLVNNFNITAGGLYQVFAANVLSNGNVDMNLQSVMVKRISSLQYDSVQSASGNLKMMFGPNVLTTNAGAFIEEDASKMVSYTAGQLDMGQIGTAYWLRVFNTSNGTAALRAGYRVYVTINYSQSDIVDANKDGVADGSDELMLNVATSALNSTSFNFNVDIKNKSVDTLNNTVSFTISNLGLQRYMLVLDGANVSQQGSIVAGDVRVSNTTGVSTTRTNNYANNAAASFVGVVSDFVSGINTGTALLLIDGFPATLSNSTIGLNTVRFTANLTNLGLAEGLHSARFLVENNNGNRLDRRFNFVIDQTVPRVISQSALFGRDTNSVISFVLSDPQTSLKPSAGVDTATVFVDVYGTKVVKNDSSEIAYEIQQFIGRLSPGQLGFSVPITITTTVVNDTLTVVDTVYNFGSLKVSFSMVDNLQRADIDGYVLVVHDGTTSLAELLNSNIGNGTSAIQFYGGSGIFDFAQNQAFPMNFRVTADFDGPDIEVAQNILEKGMSFKITDNKSGVDTLSVRIVEVDEEKGDSTVSTPTTGLNYNASTGVVTYSAKKPGNLIIVYAQDNFANRSIKEISVESEQLAAADFHSYPNPFNPEGRTAKVTFVLSRASRVTIEAFDWLGRSAGKLIESQQFDAGRVNTVEFTGRRNGEVLANGVYFLRLTANDGDKSDTKYFKAVVAVKKQ